MNYIRELVRKYSLRFIETSGKDWKQQLRISHKLLMCPLGFLLGVKNMMDQGKSEKISLIYIAGILVGMPIYFFLIPKHGIQGAVVASSVTYFAAFSFSFWQLHCDYRVPLRDIIIPQNEDLKYVKMQLAKILVLKRWLQLE